MLHVRSLEDVSLQNSWLTIGVFDGVHRGHQAILKGLAAGAHANGASAVVLTFHPHPGVVLGKRADLKYLSLPGEKASLLAALGVDVVVTLPFDTQVAALSAEDFMRRIQAHLNVKKLSVGYDFALGRGRKGDVNFLTGLGEEIGYTVQTFGPVTNGRGIISSSHIRAYLAAGRVDEAKQALGHPYALHGLVIHGDGRGRKINIPTANIEVSTEKAIPANGVYACRATIGNAEYAAVTNIGIRPTFTPDKEQANIETHLLDFQGNLYDQDLGLEFVFRLRNEQKFDSVDALLAQIRVDITRAKDLLNLANVQ